MKQVFANDRGEVYVKDCSRPALGEAGVVIETLASFIGTGSEIHTLRTARAAPGDGTGERALSYQSCGRVVEVAPGERDFAVGDVVACAGSGFAMHGEMAYVPKLMLAKVPEGVRPEEAAAANLGLTALHALRRSRFEFGESVVVIGLGLVGLMLVQMVRASGGVAIGVDLLDARLELARALGCELVLQPGHDDVAAAVRAATGGVGADVVIICAASPESSVPLELACDVARDKGRVVVPGLIKIDISFFALRNKELDLLVSRARGAGTGDPSYERDGVDYPLPYVRWTENRNLQEYLRMVARGAVQIAPLITHRFPITRAAEAYEILLHQRDNALGVVLEYGDG